MAPFIRTQYNMDAKQNSDYTGITFLDKSLTQQQFKDSADINVLFGKYLETGEIPQVEGMGYGDFTGIFDFQSAMNAVRAAEESFAELPARIKNRFDNNPQKLVEFINDPENREEAEFLKIVAPRPAELPKEPVMEAGQLDKPEPKPARTTGGRNKPGTGPAAEQQEP